MPLKVTLAPGDEREFTDESLVKMGDVTLRTKRAERAFSLCREQGKIVPSFEHIGGPHSVSFKDCSALRLPKAGSFHTHPTGDSKPSWFDGYSALCNSELNKVRWLGCVGSPKDEMVRCHAPKEIPSREVVDSFHRERGKHLHQPLEEDPRLTAIISEVAKITVRHIPGMIVPKIPVGLAPPGVPVPVAPVGLQKQPQYDEQGALVGFTIVDPEAKLIRKRANIVNEIHEQHPELSIERLDNSAIVYYDFGAEVRLRR